MSLKPISEREKDSKGATMDKGLSRRRDTDTEDTYDRFLFGEANLVEGCNSFLLRFGYIACIYRGGHK